MMRLVAAEMIQTDPMEDQERGVIISTSSVAAFEAQIGQAAYAASKGALHQITQSLSHHLISRGITVNAVNPGPTDTGWASEDVFRAVLANSPRGRWGTSDDVARLIAWLATDDAEWVTGQVINSTGGM